MFIFFVSYPHGVHVYQNIPYSHGFYDDQNAVVGIKAMKHRIILRAMIFSEKSSSLLSFFFFGPLIVAICCFIEH
jgi:hypothetical protein